VLVGSGVFVGVSVWTGAAIAKVASSLMTPRCGRGKMLGPLAAHVRPDSRVHQPTAAYGRERSASNVPGASAMGPVTLPNFGCRFNNALGHLAAKWQHIPKNGSIRAPESAPRMLRKSEQLC
jgi:hypothetical protein